MALKTFKSKKKKPDGGDDRVRYYHSKYVNYHRAIAVMWGVLVVAFLIIALVCLIQPTWLGTERDAPGRGYFGLWRYYATNGDQIEMRGSFLKWSEIPSAAFQATTVFVGLSVLLAIICILCFFLFICVSAKVVFIICGIILTLIAICMLLACIIYPSGWGADVVANTCGSESYDAGRCKIQWTYILAIVAIFDAIILAVLAFVLAFKHTKLLPWQEKAGAAYVIDDQGSGRGEVQYVQTMPVQTMQTVQTVPVVNGSQPVILVESGSVRSQPVGTLRSHKSNKRNFQL